MTLGIANRLTLFRIILVPVLLGAFLIPGVLGEALRVGILLVAAATDWCDGYLARTRGETSSLGATLDPAADKMIVATALLMLAGSGNLSVISVVAAAVILAREFLVSAVRETVGRNGDQLQTSQMAKWKTAIQFVALVILSAGSLAMSLHPLVARGGEWMLWVAAVLAVASGHGYISSFWYSIRDGDER